MALTRGHVLCAPGSFKESLSAAEAARAMAAGAVAAGFTAEECPVADGGEGALHLLATAWHVPLRTMEVCGPLGEPVSACFGQVQDSRSAVVELAQASGLGLVDAARRDPARTTTYGTGQVIAEVLRRGARRIIVCIGGSATVDGGTGIVQALGGRFFDRAGRLIDEPMCGGRLLEIARYERPLKILPLRVACDVTNPLCGPEGAAAVYGPQKGATPQQVIDLDAGLSHLASVCGGDPDQPGAGAAGGAGYGLAAMLGANLVSGIELVLAAVDFAAYAVLCDLVLTGEGRLDAQSLYGKASVGVARAAAALGKPTVAIVGQHRVAVGLEPLFTSIVSLEQRFGLGRAMIDPVPLMATAARDFLQSRTGEPRAGP